MGKIEKYDYILIVIILIIINYLLITLHVGSFDINKWDIIDKLHFEAYFMFDLLIGLFFYLTKKV